ncbi:glycosyltransferase family 2 protein [Paraburkholderia tropica]|uniref:glycosyltransferase family 2 protein n=1 Tax=Paraburkholderia tropica TaxID=92647 RepID=UPI003D6D82FB
MISTLGRAAELLRQEGLSGVRRRVLGRIGGSAEAARRNNYAEWIKRYDRLDAAGREAIAQRVAAMTAPPRISILMPVYNPQREWLAEAIASVRAQLYPHWELCIADDASTDAQVRAFLEAEAQADSRIKIVFRAGNGHISAATNSALELASGAWIALLDQDDLLPAHALFWAADAIVANPALRLIYSDEDKIDESGERYEPYFKCDWNRELFYGQNLFSHLGVFERALVEQVGGFRVGFEGAQDHDLVLRCIEHVDESAIHHIPRVLYHWRAHGGSTAATAESKPYAALAGERALNEHYVRRGMRARAEWIGYGYRTHEALPDAPPLVSLVIPTRNGHELVRQCVDSIIGKTTYPNYEILIVDNGSDETATLAYLAALTADPRIRVLRDDGPFNFSALNNRAVAAARGELVGLVNNDIEVRSPDWLSEMVALALRPGVGAVGARLLYPDETLQHGGIIVGIGGVAGHANKHTPAPYRRWFDRTALTGEWSAVTAACLIVTRAAYEAVGGLNEQDLAVAFNDVDFCLRLQEAGYRNLATPFAELFHHESATRGYEDNPAKRARFRTEIDYMHRRWGAALQRDRAYSPNLTLEHEDFSLAWPPRVASLLESAQ